ncbi:MAG: hypothetical protein QNK25_11775 [Desulfobacterales bacterium]|nr:hypothetical protein [Desulfobacterales bacterium]
MQSNIAIVFTRKLTDLSLRGIGTEFGLKKYRAISSIVARAEALLRQDKQLRKQVAEIKKLMISNKSQAKT